MNKFLITALFLINKYFILTFMFGVVATPVRADVVNRTPIHPEVTTSVELSNSDVNRIVCPGAITDLIYSAEKGIEGHFSRNNAFVKFKITKLDDELRYAKNPTELFVICNSSVYSLIALPKRIPAVTLQLARNSAETIKATTTRFRAMPFEKKILVLIREAYLNEYPPGYRITPIREMVNLSVDLKVELIRIVDVDGSGLRLKEYEVMATESEKLIQLNEKFFLNPKMGERIVAVSLLRHALDPGEKTRVFVIEQKGEVT